MIFKIPVEVTAYTARPEETDDTPTITASGQQVRLGIVALSRDLEHEFGLQFGDMVEIEGLGVFEFQDRMNRRIKRGVDIFFNSYRKAIQFGRKNGTLILTSTGNTDA